MPYYCANFDSMVKTWWLRIRIVLTYLLLYSLNRLLILFELSDQGTSLSVWDAVCDGATENYFQGLETEY